VEIKKRPFKTFLYILYIHVIDIPHNIISC